MNSRRRVLVRGSLLLLAAFGLAAGVYVLSTVPPTQQSYYPKCQFYQLTGLHCPGCGTTRALSSLVNGRPGEAIGFNILAVLVAPYLAYSIGRSLWHWLWGTPLRTRAWPPKLIWSFVALVILFWVVRNIPLYPFTLLAPHEIAP
jgi:hypothetical protein